MERDAATREDRLRPVVVVPPTAMTGDKQVVDVGGIEVQVLYPRPRPHRRRPERLSARSRSILFMSEAYLNRVFPAMRSAYPSEWLKTLDRALAMNVRHYIPGHGFIEDPKASREELRRVSEGAQATSSTRSSGCTSSVCRRKTRASRRTGDRTRSGCSRTQQDIIAIRKVYEEIEGKLSKMSDTILRAATRISRS